MSLLKFKAAYKLTYFMNDEETFAMVALAPKVLPADEGVEVRCIVNNPIRFEVRIIGEVVNDDPLEIELAPVPLEEATYKVRFEPLTKSTWLTLEVADYEELSKQFKNDEQLLNYYWNDWIPEYWLEDQDQA